MKAKVVYVFRNGDKHHTGVKLTVGAKFKTFDQVKNYWLPTLIVKG